MAFKTNSTDIQPYTEDGIPYIWGKRDDTTEPYGLIQHEGEFVPGSQGFDRFSQFGYSISVGSGRIVIGALGYDGGRGRVYIYDTDKNNENVINTLTGTYYSQIYRGNNFGSSVSVGCGRIVVGARQEVTSGNSRIGAVYIYDLNGNLINTLYGTNPLGLTNGPNFGESVAIGCDRIVVGAVSSGVNSAGSAYIYDLDGNLLKTINSTEAFGELGRKVVVGNGRITISSRYDQYYGAVDVYDLYGNFIKRLQSVDPSGAFGFRVSIACGRIVVSDYLAGNTMQGKAYIYDLDGNLLKILEGMDFAQFGLDVAVGCGKIVVAAGQYGEVGNNNYIYDLDGNFLNGLDSKAISQNPGVSFNTIAIGEGKLIFGAPYANNFVGTTYSYNIPSNYTPYDAADIVQFG